MRKIPPLCHNSWFCFLSCGFLLLAACIPWYARATAQQFDPQASRDKINKPMAQHDPQRPIIFNISFEEKSQVGGASWSIKGEARYALLPAWDGQKVIGADVPRDAQQQMNARLARAGAPRLQAAVTAEGLFNMRGGPLYLKPGEVLQFYVKEFESQGSGTIANDNYSWTETIRDGVRQLNACGATSTHKEELADLTDANLKRNESGAALAFRWTLDTYCDFGAGASILGFSTQEAKQILTFQLTEDDLSNWNRVNRTNSGTIHGPDGADPSYPVTLRATLKVVDSAPGEVTVEIPDYDSWEPRGNLEDPSAAGVTLDIKVKAHRTGRPGEPLDKKVNFTFKLEDVSSQPGVCMNFPREGPASSEDLMILKEAGRNTNITISSAVLAHTENPATEATLTVASLDFGAWGRLAIEAETTDHRKLSVYFRDKKDESISIPRDIEFDHIADSWEERHEVGKAATEDNDAQPSGQARDGDGMSTYEEYRGFVVLGPDGGKKHQQMDPGVKELFIIDEDNIFDTAVWKNASGITAVRFAPDMVQGGDGDTGRIVNFRYGFAHIGNKYCVRVDRIPPERTPPDTSDEKNSVWTLGRMKSRPCESPKYAEMIEVYPGNISKWVESIVSRLVNAVADPNSADGQSFKELGVPTWMWKRALDRMGEGTKEKLVEQFIRQTAIHEVGHACGLNGHTTADGTETDKGNAKCFMKYTDKRSKRELLILQTLFKSDATLPLQYSIFCKDPDFHCWKHLNVKDE